MLPHRGHSRQEGRQEDTVGGPTSGGWSGGGEAVEPACLPEVAPAGREAEMHPFAPQSLWGAEGCLHLFTGTSPPDLKAWTSLATLPSQLSGFTNPPPPFPGKRLPPSVTT